VSLLKTVEEANNKSAIDTSVIAAKVAMDDVPTGEEMAEILSEFDLTDPKNFGMGQPMTTSK
jgi:hypothetical protein